MFLLHKLYNAVGWLYEHWGSMSQLIVGLMAFLLAMLPSTVAELEKKPKWKFGIPLLVGVIAITGYVVSESNDIKLKGQLDTLFRQVSVEATKDDITSLGTHIDNGFRAVVDAIAALRKPNKPVQVVPHTTPSNIGCSFVQLCGQLRWQ
jgi:hypothetical protein